MRWICKFIRAYLQVEAQFLTVDVFLTTDLLTYSNRQHMASITKTFCDSFCLRLTFQNSFFSKTGWVREDFIQQMNFKAMGHFKEHTARDFMSVCYLTMYEKKSLYVPSPK